MAALQNPGRVHPLAAWSRELPGPEGELGNIWPLSGRVGGRAWGQSWPPPPAGGRCPGGLRVVRRCVQLEGTLRQDEDWGLLGVRARRPSQGPAREAFDDSCGATGPPAGAPPAPLCLPRESGPRGQGRRWPGRASTSLFSPVGSGPGPDLVRLQLSLTAPTSLFNKVATAWLRGGWKTRRSCAGGSAVTPCVFPVTSYLCKRRRLFALGDNVSRERKSALVNSSARDPKCPWLGEVLLTLAWRVQSSKGWAGGQPHPQAWDGPGV